MTSKLTTTFLTPSMPSSVPWRPHAFQKRAVKFLLEHAAAALFLDPGLGKTSITLAALKLLKERGLISKVLLIAPLRVAHATWPAEIQKWADFAGLKCVVLHGTKKEQLLQTDADLFIINPEGLEWLLEARKVKSPNGKFKVEINLPRFKSFGFDTLVIDELSLFKHTNTVKFKALKQVLHLFGRRWGLTGSPAANGLIGLFGQCYVLDQGRTLGPYITHFLRTYFTPGYDGFSWVLREGADQEIYKRLKPLALRMSADDYLELPKLIENEIRVDLPPTARRVYLELEEELITAIADRKVTAATAGVATMKCRQVASGAVYLDQEVEALVKLPKSQRDWAKLHDAKLDALDELIEELQGEPLLIAYDFGHDLARLQERYGKDLPFIGGGVSPKQSEKILGAWNRRELPLLAAHPLSAARGLNAQLGGSHHLAWFSLTWDYELYDQLIRRLRRQGQTATRVFSHLLIARGTVDEYQLMVLTGKKHGQNAFFQALKTGLSRK